MNAVPDSVEHARPAIALVGAQQGIAPAFCRVDRCTGGLQGSAWRPEYRGRAIGAVSKSERNRGRRPTRSLRMSHLIGDLADRGEDVGDLSGIEDGAAAPRAARYMRQGSRGRHSRELFDYAHGPFQSVPNPRYPGRNLMGHAKTKWKDSAGTTPPLHMVSVRAVAVRKR